MSNIAAHEDAAWVPETTFASRLVLLRHHLGLTQVEAAAKCGLDDGSWSNWERGGKPRGMDQVVEKIAETFNVDRNWLMWGVATMRWITGLPAPDPGQLSFDEYVPTSPSLTVVT